MIVYLHTKGGCCIEGLFLTRVTLPQVAVILFDFAGSGYSEGDHITLGIKESRDTIKLLETFKEKYNINNIILWGRSMGAVTALKVS